MATTSDVMVETLIDWGVDTIFGFPGDGVDGVFESLRTHQDKIRFIQVRHEEAAAFSACAYAKLTGRLGVCIATSGPGAVHLLNGLYDAKMDGAAVLAITGQTESDLLGMSYTQEIDLNSLFKDVSAYTKQVQHSGDAHNLISTACLVALSGRTVTHISIPIDFQSEDFKDEYYSSLAGPPKAPDQLLQPVSGFYSTPGTLPDDAPVPSRAALRRAAKILNDGARIAILVGHGALNARQEVETLADQLGAPVVKALQGKGVIPDDSPYSTGGIGLLGTQPSVNAMNECDVLLMIGTSFPYASYLPKPDQARGIQIDLDKTRLGLRFPVEVGLVGDARATIQALIPLLQHKSDRSFLEARQEDMKGWNNYIRSKGTSTDMPMKPQVVANTLQKLVRPDAIICGDSGTNTTWIARDFCLTGDQRFILSGNLATMGPGLPYAVAAQIAFPERQVVAFVGDGGFTMLMGEMLTAVKYKLPIKVIIIKNNILGQIKWEQIVFLGNPQFGVKLQPADFAGWARAAGGEGYCVEKPDEIEDVMREFLASPNPAILEAVVDPDEPPLPPSVSLDQAKHFAQALVKGEPHPERLALTAFRDKIEEWWKS